MPKGKFITLEGGEGAGKSTQIRLLLEALEHAGHKALHTREPGGTEGAEAIRNLLVQGDPQRWDAVTETLLFYAARRNHMEKLVWPALEAGTHVICDRFADSTRVYQGYGKGLGDDYVMALHRLALGNFQPDLTLWLDVDAQQGLSRAGSRENDKETRFESMKGDFHERVRYGFADIAKKESRRIVRIDAAQPISNVHADIIRAVNTHLEFNLPVMMEGI